MLITIVLILVVAAGLTPLILRDLERAQTRRAVVRVFLSADGAAFLEAMRRAAESIEAFVREMNRRNADWKNL